MQFDRDKGFGYPVLRPRFKDDDEDDLDYVNSSLGFSLQLEVSVDNKNEGSLIHELTIGLHDLIRYIEQEKARVILNIQCRKTFFSQQIPVSLKGNTQIDLTKLRDTVDIMPFVLATQDFVFASDKIHPDFEMSEFSVEAGSVLAWYPEVPFSVERDVHRSLRSILDFQPDESLKYAEYFLSVENDYVKVHAHPDFIEMCRTAERIPRSHPALLASFYVPVISELLLDLANNETLAEDYRWASILLTKANEKDLEWSDPRLIHYNAQVLMKNPLEALSSRKFLSE